MGPSSHGSPKDDTSDLWHAGSLTEPYNASLDMLKSYRFDNPTTGKTEHVPGEALGWKAVYSDGTKLHQFDDATGTFHRIGEVDQSRLQRFMVVGRFDGGSKLIIDWKPGMKLVHRYEVRAMQSGKAMSRRVVFGWKLDGQHCLFTVRPNGDVVAWSE